MADCSDCVKIGSFWQGEPSGEIITYESTKAYVARPKQEVKRAVLMVPDVFGMDFKNNQLVVDKFAEKGYLTVLPDYFAAHPVPIHALRSGDIETFMKWQQACGPDVYNPISDKFLKFLNSQGANSIGVIGYCWGGRPAVLLAATDKVKALVVNHGSFLTNDDLKAIKHPAQFNGADNDRHIPKEKFVEFEEILAKEKISKDFKFYDGMPHGWTVKGDDNDPKLSKGIEDAFSRNVSWFDKHT